VPFWLGSCGLRHQQFPLPEGPFRVVPSQAGLVQRVKVPPEETPGSPVADSRRRVRTRPSKRSDKPRLAGCELVVRTMRNPASVEKPGLVTGHRREPNLSRNGEGHGRRPCSWSGRRRTLRRTGSGTSTRSGPELGRSSSARGSDARPRKRCPSITGDPGKWRAAERKSEGLIGSDDGADNTTHRSEGALPHLCLGWRYERVNAHRG